MLPTANVPACHCPNSTASLVSMGRMAGDSGPGPSAVEPYGAFFRREAELYLMYRGKKINKLGTYKSIFTTDLICADFAHLELRVMRMLFTAHFRKGKLCKRESVHASGLAGNKP